MISKSLHHQSQMYIVVPPNCLSNCLLIYLRSTFIGNAIYYSLTMSQNILELKLLSLEASLNYRNCPFYWILIQNYLEMSTSICKSLLVSENATLFFNFYCFVYFSILVSISFHYTFLNYFKFWKHTMSLPHFLFWKCQRCYILWPTLF